MRHELDFYETPSWTVDALLDRLNGKLEKVSSILDPAAGNGALIRGINDCRITAIDIDARHRRQLELITPDVWIGDFLETSVGTIGVHDMIICNPPYNYAEAFVRHAMGHDGKKEWFAPVGYFLLRLNFLASKGRKFWMREKKPNVYVLSKRPSFTGDGRTDGTEYAWFEFKITPTEGKWEIL